MSKQTKLSFGQKRAASPAAISGSPAKKAARPPTESTSTAGCSYRHPAPPSFDIAKAVTDSSGQRIEKQDLDLLQFSPFLTAPGRDQLFRYLLEELPWYRVKYRTRGIEINTPRYTTVFGCDDTGAPASAYKIRPRVLPEVLQTLKHEVERKTGGHHFNFVLVNYYAGGNDSISWHSDDEKFLGPNPTIASLSLGAPRDFLMKHKPPITLPTEKWKLSAGDMIVMQGPTQAHWLHSVPKRKDAAGRMNLTFRCGMSVACTNNYFHYNVGTGPVHKWDGDQMVPLDKVETA